MHFKKSLFLKIVSLSHKIRSERDRAEYEKLAKWKPRKNKLVLNKETQPIIDIREEDDQDARNIQAVMQ